jgi:hypothetical protein
LYTGRVLRSRHSQPSRAACPARRAHPCNSLRILVLRRIFVWYPTHFPDTGLFLIPASPTFATRVVTGELETLTHNWTRVFDVGGVKYGIGVGGGVTDCNGAVLTNSVVILRLSGSLPLRMDTASLLGRRPERRFISGEVTTPITALAYSFGPHPMQELYDFLGPGLISVMEQGDRVESFRIKSNRFRDESGPGRPAIGGHEIIGRGHEQGPALAKLIVSSIINDKNRLGVQADCEFAPRNAFRVWHGKELALLLICFDCHEIYISHYDAMGKLIREARFYLESNADMLEHLSKQCFSASSRPQKKKTKRKLILRVCQTQTQMLGH